MKKTSDLTCRSFKKT